MALVKALGCLVVLLLAGVALGQSRPTLVDAPLEVRLAMPDMQVQALQDDFRQALAASSAVLLPTHSTWRNALNSLERNDCDVRDECLQQLALASTSLYALFASVERNAAGTELTATGRVVNQDGRLVRTPVQVTVPDRGRAPALEALKLLIRRLELDQLPGVLGHAPELAVPQPIDFASFVPPPLPAPEPEPEPEPRLGVGSAPAARSSPARVAAWVTLGVAVAAGGVSLGFGLDAVARREALPADGRFTTEAQGQAQRQVDRSATVSLGAGAGAGALLVTSLVLFAVSSPVVVAVVPSSTGGTIALAGSF